MKKINFLIKIYQEKKLQLVESSEEIKDSYLEKANSSLLSAKILLENNLLEESVSLAYYGMYHLVSALLFKTGIKCENHSAGIILLKELFGINNEEISFAKKERIDKQYYVGFEVNKQEVEETIKVAEKFQGILLDFISKLNQEDTNKYKKILKESLY